MKSQTKNVKAFKSLLKFKTSFKFKKEKFKQQFIQRSMLLTSTFQVFIYNLYMIYNFATCAVQMTVNEAGPTLASNNKLIWIDHISIDHNFS